MRLSPLARPALLAALPLLAQPGLPDVQERRLSNGSRILLVERPGSGAFHARLFFRGGRSEAPPAPPAAVDRVAEALWARLDPSDTDSDPALEALLVREAGTYDALTRARLGRQRRGGEAEGLEKELASLHASHLATLRTRLPEPGMPDLLAGLGAARRGLRVESDFVETSLDLPSQALAAWIRLEVARLQHVRLPWFPILRGSQPPPTPDRYGLLLQAAVPGAQYGLGRGGSTEALGWPEARAMARRLFSVDRLVLVVVGDLSGERALPILEQALGRLPTPEPSPLYEGLGTEPPPGARRVSAIRPGPSRLLVGWRVPPLDHPDTPALRLLADALGEGRSARLRSTFLNHGLAQSVDARLGVPGTRLPGLLALEVVPEEGHGLSELALAVEGEALRLQQEPLDAAAFERLIRRRDTAEALRTVDPDALARMLGEATATTGDWRQAFPGRGVQLRPEEVQTVARRYLVPALRTEVFVEPDPLEATADPLDARLVEALRRLASARIPERERVDEVVRQGMRQLRMLSREDREAALRLLTSSRGGR